MMTSDHNIRTASRHNLQWTGNSVVFWVSLLWCRSLWALFDWILWPSPCCLQKQGTHSTRTKAVFTEYTYKLMKRKKKKQRETEDRRFHRGCHWLVLWLWKWYYSYSMDDTNQEISYEICVLIEEHYISWDVLWWLVIEWKLYGKCLWSFSLKSRANAEVS